MPIKLTHGGSDEFGGRIRGLESTDETTSFDYLFQDLVGAPTAHLPMRDHAPLMVRKLLDLAEAMIPDSEVGPNLSTIPPVYTYWGQFIDHDITATDSDKHYEQLILGILQADREFQPLEPDYICANLRNQRLPFLDLDSIYSGGPTADTIGIYDDDGIRFALGQNHNLGDELTPEPELGLVRDLPRIAAANASEAWPIRTARIGDSRNDENLLIAQFTVAMLKFHNAIVDWVEQREQLMGDALFQRARDLTRWHFQWLVVHDYLKTIALPAIVAQVMDCQQTPFTPKVFMPLEFSAAAFRFGHSMVRQTYNYNRNFGAPRPGATLDQLFDLTGRGGLSNSVGSHPSLPNSWIIEWARFVDKNGPPEDFARKIDTNLAPSMSRLVNEWQQAVAKGFEDRKRKIFRHMAKRTLLRGYLFQLPSGQAVAERLGVQPLTPPEVRRQRGDGNQLAVLEGVLAERTPLWYYILKEAELQTDGNSLGEVGSHIVVQTIIGLLKRDPCSYINRHWEPSQGVSLGDGSPIRTIMDLFRFAGVANSGW